MDNYEAGAGRGRMGGPTAKELADYEAAQNKGIFTADKLKRGQEAPRDLMPEDFKKMRTKKYAKGGAVTRGDGCVSKGHTKGKMR